MGRILEDEHSAALRGATMYCDPDEPLAVGAAAPDFEWTDDAGKRVQLSDLRGQPVLLAFFAAHWDPARSHQLWMYNEVLQRLPNGGCVLGLAQDGRWCEIMLDNDETMRFPLLGDLGVEGEIARRYGVAGSPAIFVIDDEGIVRWRHVAADGMQAHFDDLVEAIAPVPERRTVSRREFLVTTLAISLAVAVVPRLGHAQSATKPVAVDDRSVVAVKLNVNGEDHTLQLEPRVTLLDALRERMGLTGTKKGCDHGQCGACTVHVDGRRVNACLTLAMQAEGSRIVTIEGLARGKELHPVQAAFVERDGFQCGYCTPGQIMSAVACIEEGHAGSEAEIAEWMSGNICRCGAYNGIRGAIVDARKRSARPA
jgi:xanthine dehydrogenase YagT iron-sulfur-binding subunit